ncbi:aminotransferase class I/II-fold pyridoxal phosphate-dependent enzyme [Nocardia anaemiae]|uniref:aminotransferase class I/II-fold pyridoxal phosphate-dependent enzyme n=1 Tax=Nocardia anaemiae TaxID=263910 RepID=UPI0007A54BDE|nr:aminotransferase class I/II-fold pyridoxal phosphate-dependent enzyme [Nocardia anaemiae]
MTTPRFTHRPSVLDARWEPRGDYRGMLNLKSCEMQHPWADELLTDVLAGVRAQDIRSYPYHVDLMRMLAELNGVDADCVLLTAGSCGAIAMTVDGLAEPAGLLIAQEPVFDSWTYYAALRGVAVSRTAGLVGSPPILSATALKAVLSASPPAVVALTNPGNPSGLVMALNDVADLARLAQRYGHTLVIDECYAAFSGVSHAPLIAIYPNVIVLQSLSKSWALAGARLAAVFGAPETVDYLRRFRTDSAVSGTAVALAHGLSARLERIRAIWTDVAAIRDEFTERVLADHPGWIAVGSVANFATFWLGGSGEGQRAEKILREDGIRVRGLDDIPGMGGCLRISMADRRDMVRVADVIRDRI